jgi:hypothetical protein
MQSDAKLPDEIDILPPSVEEVPEAPSEKMPEGEKEAEEEPVSGDKEAEPEEPEEEPKEEEPKKEDE